MVTSQKLTPTTPPQIIKPMSPASTTKVNSLETVDKPIQCNQRIAMQQFSLFLIAKIMKDKVRAWKR